MYSEGVPFFSILLMGGSVVFELNDLKAAANI